MFFLVLCAALLTSCDRPPAQAPTLQVEQADKELLEITQNAQRTLYIFFQHLNAPGAKEHDFYVKFPFSTDQSADADAEQVWLTGIRFKDGTYTGVLANEPAHIGGMSKGDTVVFGVDAITDWMFVKDGKIAGGRSIRYLLEKTPENERTESQRRLLQMFDD